MPMGGGIHKPGGPGPETCWRPELRGLPARSRTESPSSQMNSHEYHRRAQARSMPGWQACSHRQVGTAAESTCPAALSQLLISSFQQRTLTRSPADNQLVASPAHLRPGALPLSCALAKWPRRRGGGGGGAFPSNLTTRTRGQRGPQEEGAVRWPLPPGTPDGPWRPLTQGAPSFLILSTLPSRVFAGWAAGRRRS